MLESYIRTGDGKDYVDVDCVREALGIVDEYVDILGVIRKLREEKDAKIDGLKADLELTKRLYKENRDFVDKVCEAVDIQRPYSKSGYDSTVKLISGFKKERDALKDRVRRLKIQANSIYGAGCGYSEHNDSIRVELNMTPNAIYKGTIDMEDLRRYIQEYGREKKLGIVESVDYLNAKAARAELKRLYKTVLGIKDTRDIDLSPRAIVKAILDEYRRREDFIRELSCSLGFGDPVVKQDNIDQKEKDILERIEKLKGGVWPCENSSTFAEHLRKQFPKFCKQYNVYPLTNASIHDWLQYIFDVLADYRGMHDSEWARVEKLQEFRNDVCKILDIPSSMADDQEQILKEIHDFADRYYELRDFRADICGILNLDGLLGTPKQNDKYILEQVEKLKNDGCKPTVFRNDVAIAIGMTTKDSNPDIIKRVMEIRESHDRLARLRSNICTALCIGHEDCDGNIIGRIHMMQDCHEKLCKDYAKLHDDYISSQKQVKGFTNRCDSLEDLHRDLWELRKNAIADLKTRGFLFRDDENETLREIFAKLLKRYDWTYGSYKEQYRLRQCWHARYESEHERANGEHKRAEKLLAEGAALKNQVELLKISSNAKANELVALQAFKNECRKLRDEKTKVISALGQDIWDDCLK